MSKSVRGKYLETHKDVAWAPALDVMSRGGAMLQVLWPRGAEGDKVAEGSEELHTVCAVSISLAVRLSASLPFRHTQRRVPSASGSGRWPLSGHRQLKDILERVAVLVLKHIAVKVNYTVSRNRRSNAERPLHSTVYFNRPQYPSVCRDAMDLNVSQGGVQEDARQPCLSVGTEWIKTART